MSSIDTAQYIANVSHWPLRIDLLNMLDELRTKGAMNQQELCDVHLYLLFDRPLFTLLMMNQNYPGLRQGKFFWILLIIPITGLIRVHRLLVILKSFQTKEVRISLGLLSGAGVIYCISYLYFLILTV